MSTQPIRLTMLLASASDQPRTVKSSGAKLISTM